MEFREAKPIYAQIADTIREAVIRGSWEDEDRIPSIREMAVETEVNPNTITRTYGLLQEEGIVYNRRGVGYFVAPGARERIRSIMRDEFLSQEVPEFFRKIDVLGIPIAEIVDLYRKRRKGFAEHGSEDPEQQEV